MNKVFHLSCVINTNNIVKLLLTDERVDPSANNNYAIKHALLNSHTEIVRLLSEDRRVNPPYGVILE